MNKLLKSFRLSFSRRPQKQIDPQIIQQRQLTLFEKCNKKGFKQPNQFNHQDILFQQTVYGHKCQITGITQNNLKSAQFTQQVIGTSRPKLVILGGMNDTQAMATLQQPMGRFLNIENLISSKLFCKSTLLPLIQKRIQQEMNYIYDKKSKLIWKIDSISRSFQINDYINAAYQSLFSDYKLIYGKPSSVFIYQDLILNLDLQQLQLIFQNTLKKVQEKHQNSCQHVASVILQHFKTYAMYQQPKLYHKQITYTTALLNRLTKIQSGNLLLIPTCFVTKIAQQVHNIDFEPQSVYRKWTDDHNSQSYGRFSNIIMDKRVQQILQKFAILSILKGFHLQLALYQGKNFFKNSIFNDLLGNYQPQQILQLYRPYKAKYMNKLFDIQRKRIKNKIQYSPPQTQYMYLKDQFNTLQKRQKMFLYQFQPKNYITEQQNQTKLINLHKKIDQIVELQSDEYQKTLYEEYKKGNRSKQNIILFSKLVGKANVQLKQKVRLPYYHFNAFRGFYKQYYRDSLLFDQDVKARKLQMKKLRKIEQNFDRIGKQLKDPQMIRKYLSGQMGKDQNGQIDIDGQMDDLQQVVAQLGNDQMKKEFEQFRKKNPRQQHNQLGQDDEINDDSQDQDSYQQQIKYKKRR